MVLRFKSLWFPYTSNEIRKNRENHFEKQSKIKHNMLQVELELEKLKHENFLMETEKMRLELDQMKFDQKIDEPRLL